jgi:predicted nucleic acid-binding protein
LELLYSTRNIEDFERFTEELGTLPELGLRASVVRRAEDVQRALADGGRHRGPSPVDLLIAATAEVHGATLWHYDRHFDLITEVTGQATEWLAPRGTLD